MTRKFVPCGIAATSCAGFPDSTVVTLSNSAIELRQDVDCRRADVPGTEDCNMKITLQNGLQQEIVKQHRAAIVVDQLSRSRNDRLRTPDIVFKVNAAILCHQVFAVHFVERRDDNDGTAFLM
jgi:hypothetical protein